jgi:2-dehydro-3-deoxyglucarate aldolase/4-hydroxy-2-oxoheptanedioate aldolase
LGAAHTDYLAPDPVAFFQRSNANTTVIAQIESPVGLSNLDAIAATPGVDILWVGHFDLSTAMGIPAQFDHPDFLRAMQSVVATSRHYGKLAGVQPGSLEQAQRWLAMGFNVISWKADTALFGNALRTEIAALRATLT